jgi:uncharacterized protein with HEPN domain
VRSDRERILDILEAIERIERRAGDEQLFMADELLQVWVVHHLEIIGEAAGNVSDELRERAPEIPWPVIVAQRNQLVHAYFRIDARAVWKTVERDLPLLREQLNAIIDDLRDEG